MEVSFGDKTIEIPVRKSHGIKGLMFTRREKARALLFENVGAIHSFFVFFPFVILWLDDGNNVVDWKIVQPFSPNEKTKKKFSRIIEIPINKRYHSIVKFVVGERFIKISSFFRRERA